MLNVGLSRKLTKTGFIQNLRNPRVLRENSGNQGSYQKIQDFLRSQTLGWNRKVVTDFRRFFLVRFNNFWRNEWDQREMGWNLPEFIICTRMYSSSYFSTLLITIEVLPVHGFIGSRVRLNSKISMVFQKTLNFLHNFKNFSENWPRTKMYLLSLFWLFLGWTLHVFVGVLIVLHKKLIGFVCDTFQCPEATTCTYWFNCQSLMCWNIRNK